MLGEVEAILAYDGFLGDGETALLLPLLIVGVVGVDGDGGGSGDFILPLSSSSY